MADALDAELRSELGNYYWTAPPQTPKRKQRVECDWSVDKMGQPMAILTKPPFFAGAVRRPGGARHQQRMEV